MASIALDLDGTLVEKKWPEIGMWLPGAREAVRTMIEDGHTPYIYSARLSSRYTNGTLKEPALVFESRQAVRDLLDHADLSEVDIFEGDKPFWHVLVDDRAMRFPGRTNSWKRITPAVLARARAESH